MSRPRLAVVAVLALAACERKGVPLPAAMDPVSEEEARALAVAFERAVEPCDGAKLQPLLDGETLIRRALQGAKLPKAEAAGVYKGMSSRGPKMGAAMCTPAGLFADTEVELLRVRSAAGRPTVLLRTHSAGRLNYVELELGKSRIDHQVRIIDFYQFSTGEWTSEGLAELATRSMGSREANQAAQRLGRVTEARNRGDNEEALRLIATFPPELRNNKQVMLIELAVVEGDDTAYQAQLARFGQAFPDDPSLDMLSLDGYYVRKDVPGLMRVLDRLDRRVGGDPYLSMFRANGYLLDSTPESLSKAEQAARVAAAALPDKEDVWWALVSVQVRQGDRAGALATLTHIEDAFDSSLDEATIADQPDWQVFLASPEYQAWVSAR